MSCSEIAAIIPSTEKLGVSSACTMANRSSDAFFASVSIIRHIFFNSGTINSYFENRFTFLSLFQFTIMELFVFSIWLDLNDGQLT